MSRADERFFWLRKRGYKGPLDQDGRVPDRANPRTREMLDVLAALAKISPPAEPQERPARERAARTRRGRS